MLFLGEALSRRVCGLVVLQQLLHNVLVLFVDAVKELLRVRLIALGRVV